MLKVVKAIDAMSIKRLNSGLAKAQATAVAVT